MPRQQRPARSRRQGNTNLPPGFGMVVVANTTIGATQEVILDLGVLATPPEAVASAVEVVLNGIPQVRRNNTSTFPTAAVQSAPGSVTLTYAAPPIVEGEILYVGAWDPSIRTKEGSWLAPGKLTVVGGG